MPIEFSCEMCSRMLRVPDGTAGKFCRCPECDTRLQIPNRIASVSSTEALQVRISVPCPNCGKDLECDASLDGTRGCCPSCAYIFTIRLDSDPNEVIAELQSFPFACPKCKQLFEGTPDRLGRKGKCTNCNEVFVIERYEPKLETDDSSKPAAQVDAVKKPPETSIPKVMVSAHPIKQAVAPKSPAPDLSAVDIEVSAVQPRPNKPTVLPSTTSADAFANVSKYIPPADVTFKPQEYHSPQSSSIPRKRIRENNKADQGSDSTLKTALIAIGCIAGIGLFLGCAGVIGFVIWSQSPKRITAGGYTAMAKGMNSRAKLPDGATEGQGIWSLQTRSEFAIIAFKSHGSMQATADTFVSNLEQTGLISAGAARPVFRAGMTGFHYRAGSKPGLPAHEGEVFSTPSGILLLFYATASELGMKNRAPKNMSDSQIEASDNPNAFFESLFKNE
jgi:hypothetical protein